VVSGGGPVGLNTETQAHCIEKEGRKGAKIPGRSAAFGLDGNTNNSEGGNIRKTRISGRHGQ